MRSFNWVDLIPYPHPAHEGQTGRVAWTTVTDGIGRPGTRTGSPDMATILAQGLPRAGLPFLPPPSPFSAEGNGVRRLKGLLARETKLQPPSPRAGSERVRVGGKRSGLFALRSLRALEGLVQHKSRYGEGYTRI